MSARTVASRRSRQYTSCRHRRECRGPPPSPVACPRRRNVRARSARAPAPSLVTHPGRAHSAAWPASAGSSWGRTATALRPMPVGTQALRLTPHLCCRTALQHAARPPETYRAQYGRIGGRAGHMRRPRQAAPRMSSAVGSAQGKQPCSPSWSAAAAARPRALPAIKRPAPTDRPLRQQRINRPCSGSASRAQRASPHAASLGTALAASAQPASTGSPRAS